MGQQHNLQGSDTVVLGNDYARARAMSAKDEAEALAADPAFDAVLAAFHPRLGRAVIEAWSLSGELALAVGEHERASLEAPDPPTLTFGC